MSQQRRFKPLLSFQDRIAPLAKTGAKTAAKTGAMTARKAAVLLPPGAEQDELLRKARQADTAAHLNEWANSPGLRPPTR